MERGADYSWSKAAEYERRAQEATDGSVRGFLCLMRDNWVTAAKALRASGRRGRVREKSKSRSARPPTCAAAKRQGSGLVLAGP